MNRTMTRRTLVKQGLIAGALLPALDIIGSTPAHADLPPLDPNDPAARGRDYIAKSAKSDAYCGTCALYKKIGDATGSCALFTGKSVAYAAWCSGWVKMGGL